MQYDTCAKLGWPLCNSCGLEDFGIDNTGCSRCVSLLLKQQHHTTSHQHHSPDVLTWVHIQHALTLSIGPRTLCYSIVLCALRAVRGAPTFTATLREVARWSSRPENAQEFLFIKLETTTNNQSQALSTQIAGAFNVSRVFSVQDLALNSGVWPTLGWLSARGKRVAFFSQNDPSTLVR